MGGSKVFTGNTRRASGGLSLQVAARHLFRHLHEARRLRKNPLVQKFFARRGDAFASPHDDDDILQSIHAAVREGAARYRDEALFGDEQLRAGRQYTIVVRQCLENRPIAEVAGMLGISVKHCYRERADIAQRIARYIADPYDPVPSSSVSESDAFYLLLDQLLEYKSLSDLGTAAEACRYLVRVAPTPGHQLEALRAGAVLAFDAVDEAAAIRAYSDAEDLFARHVSKRSGASRSREAASLALLSGLLADHYGDVDGATGSIAKAATILNRPAPDASPHARQMYIESRFYLGSVLRSQGAFEKSYDCIEEATAALQGGPISAPSLAARVTAAVWKLRNDLLATCRSWHPWAARLAGLADTFERARQAGSLSRAIEALVFLMEHHAFAGFHDEALTIGRKALALAKITRDETTVFRTSLDVGTRLLSTRYWKYGCAVLPHVAALPPQDSYYRNLSSYAAALMELRVGNFWDALTLARGDDNWGQWFTLSIRRKSVAAVSAHYLSEPLIAMNLVQDAMDAAERLGAASILQDVYRSAVIIIGDSKYKRRLDEVTRLLQR